MALSRLPLFCLALAACGAAGDTASVGDTFISTGLLSIELPREPSRYPGDVPTLLGDVRTANERGARDVSPSAARYEGTFAAESGDYLAGDGAVIVGDARIDVDLGGATAGAQFRNFEAYDVNPTDGATRPNVTGGIVSDGDLTISSGALSGDLSGTLVVSGTETFGFDGALDGIFADDEGTAAAFGEMTGTLTNTTPGSPNAGARNALDGVFYAMRN